MSIEVKDLYQEIIKYLELKDQLKFRSINKFSQNAVNHDVVKEYVHFRKYHPEEKFTLVSFCKFGYLNLAKYEYNDRKNKRIKYKINLIGHDVEESERFYFHCNNPEFFISFVSSCENGHLEIVKWLYHMGLKNKTNNMDKNQVIDSGFISARKNGQHQVADWLAGLKDNKIHPLIIKLYYPKDQFIVFKGIIALTTSVAYWSVRLWYALGFG